MSWKMVLTKRGGLREVIHSDRPGYINNTILEAIQPLRDHAERLRHAQEDRTKKELDGCRVVAVVPMTVYLQSIREGWGSKEWRRWKRDPDNAHLQVTRPK